MLGRQVEIVDCEKREHFMNRRYQSRLGDLSVGRLRWLLRSGGLLPWWLGLMSTLGIMGSSVALAQGNGPATSVPSASRLPPAAIPIPPTPSTPPIITAPPASESPQPLPQAIFVDAERGHDHQGNGSQLAPYRTLTQALQRATAGTVILLAPGVYDTAHGEVFPLRLQPDVTVQGQTAHPDQAVIIQGGGPLSIGSTLLNVTIVGADRAALVGVTVTNPNPQGHALWIGDSSPTIVENTITGNAGTGITIAGQGRPLIQRNQLQHNGMGIHIADAAQPLVRGNVLQENNVGILVTNTAQPQLFHNQFRQNRDGLVAIESAQPLVRQSLFAEQSRDGVVVLEQALPDLGTEKAAGNNRFQDNGRFDINAQAIATFIPAVGNDLERDRSLGRIDYGGRITRRIPILAGQEAVLSAGGAAISVASLPPPPTGDTPLDRVSQPAPVVSSLPSDATFVQRPQGGIAFPQPLLLAATAMPRMAPLTTAAQFPSPTLDTPRMPAHLATRYAAPVIAASSRPQISPAPTVPRSTVPATAAVTVAAVPKGVSTGVALAAPQMRTPVPGATLSLAQAAPAPPAISPNPVLAVPNAEIPIGAADGKESVWQPGQTPIVPQPASPPPMPVLRPQIPQSQVVPPPSAPAAPSPSGVSYRVVVQITSPQEQRRLQSLLPHALQVPGRPLMQVAVFGDPHPAAQLQKVLKRQGFQAAVEQW